MTTRTRDYHAVPGPPARCFHAGSQEVILMTVIDPAAQMGDFPCPLCGSLEIWIEGWPTCACDDGPPGRTLSVREAAPYLCKSPSGVYHLINDGELPVVRNSRPLRIRLIALKCYRAADHAYWRYYAIQERHEREIGT